MKTLFKGLCDIKKEDNISFHVPGHKFGRLIKPYLEREKILIEDIDFTEIDGTDNLHDADGIIKNSQDMASSLYGSRKSFFLVNGTTCGIMAMILATLNKNDKLVLPRNCHKSVYSAIQLGEINPYFIYPKVDSDSGMTIGVGSDDVIKAINECPDAKAILITYPNYSGVACDIKKIAQIAKENKMLLLVDEAHGAHLPFSSGLPISALEAGADIVVQSTHKTLPSFTQSSILHIGSELIDERRISYYLGMFQSSSPSYILMSSIDIAMDIMRNDGEKLIKNLLSEILSLKCEISVLGYNIYDETLNEDIFDFDNTKICLSGKSLGLTGHELENILKDKKIICEYSTQTYCLLVASVANTKEDFNILKEALIDIKENHSKDKGLENVENFDIIKVEKCDNTKFSRNMKKKSIDYKNAKGLVSGDFIVPYPPGVPIICPGEIINEEVLKRLEYFCKTDYKVIGLCENRIKVLV
jgi:arginine/lysine/ornithine decarboxylase